MDNTANGKEFPIMEEAFKEAKRVLRPGGIMVVAECLPFSQRYSVWCNQLHLGVTERWCKLFPTLDQYKDMLHKSGFKVVSKMNILGLDAVKHYCEPEFPLKAEWKCGTSYFGFATDVEMREIEEKGRKMIADGTITDFIKEHDKVSDAGVITILACTLLK